MALSINTNIMSINAQRHLGESQGALATAMERLSSGLRVNSAKDDAAGLYVSELMMADIRGLNQSVRNSMDGISLGQTAEGALGQIANNLQRIREIAVQSANDTVGDRTGLTAEVTQLNAENTRIITSAQFNGTSLLNAVATLDIQVGQDNGDIVSISTAVLTLTAPDVSTKVAANTTLTNSDTDIAAVATLRATFGAVQNRFEAVISNLQNYSENLTAARGRIVDADFAAETATMTKSQILQQAGISVLSQANNNPQQVLSLLQG